MGISSIRCRRWFSEFPTTPLPQPVAKNNHCCYLNIFPDHPPHSFVQFFFFTETKSSWMGHLSLRVPDSSLTLLAKGCGSWPTNLHKLLSVESKSLNVVVRLSRVRTTTWSESRLQGGGVDRPRLLVRLLGSHWLLLLTATCSSTHRRLRGLYCHVVFASIVNNCFHLKAESNQKIIFVPVKVFVSHTF